VPLETRDDRTGRAGGHTLFTDDAARSRKHQHRRLRVQRQRLRRTDTRAESTVDTEILINGNFAAGKRHIDILGAHPVDRRIEGINIAGEFHDEFAHLVRRNLGTDNIGRNVEILGQPVGDRHLNVATGEGEGDAFFHGIFSATVFAAIFERLGIIVLV
jgi:hypothetical protein